MTTHAQDLKRVSGRIASAIITYCSANKLFHASELRAHVAKECGATAPASADRILRDLRQRGTIDYEVDRAASLYRVTKVPSTETPREKALRLRGFASPQRKETPQCASCPFRAGNDVEFGRIVEQAKRADESCVEACLPRVGKMVPTMRGDRSCVCAEPAP